MKWSYPLFRAFGIDVRAHSSFLIFLGFIALSTAITEGLGSAIFASFLVCSVFGFVVLHELGHSATALHFGIPVKDITLLPMGGLARRGALPQEPWQEFLIAAAGPAVNFCFAVLFLVLVTPAGLIGFYSSFSLAPAQFPCYLLAINVGLLLFNLVPAFPMDGGRILRALLAVRMGYLRSTRIATRIGKVLCFFFFLYGLFNGNFVLCLIAIFVYFGASMELYAVESGAASRAQGGQSSSTQQQPAWWSQFPSEGPPHAPQPGYPHQASEESLPSRDLQDRFEELKAQGENVTAVYANGRIVAVIRQVD